MKKLQLLFIAFLFTGAVIAQVPNAINYQAVARNNAGQALASQTIKVRLSILRNAVSQYSETRQVTTNTLGLFNVQIGSAGALATTGSFTGINWTNNPQPLMLKVELDISNTNVFTDMGTQTFATVPYSFTAGEAVNALNIGGNYVDTNTPATGDLLKWNGTAWAPAAAPREPQVYCVAVSIQPIASGGGGGAPWVRVGNGVNLATVTVTAGQKITANFVGVFGHGNTNPQPCSFAVCYEAVINGVPSGIINALVGNSYTDGTVAAIGNKTALAATAAVTVEAGSTIPNSQFKLPPGTYRIFMAIKNKSTNVDFGGNDYVNGSIIVF